MKGMQKKTGRPLSFDRAKALEQAMLTFWRYGYESTSITALTAAMGVTPPSLYATFGDKKQLFLEAMQLYVGDPAVIASTLDAAPSARVGAAIMLDGAATAFTGESTPPGCLLASATASGSVTSADVQAAVAAVRAEICSMLRQRIERDIREGKLAANRDAQALADLIVATIQGMSVLARDGISRTRLLSLAQQVLACFPQD